MTDTKSIRVIESNQVVLEQKLKEAQGKARERCFKYSELVDLTNAAESKLEQLGVPKKYRNETTLVYSYPTARKSKKWSIDTSKIELKRRKEGWDIITISRFSNSFGDINCLTLPDEAIVYIAKQFKKVTI